MRESKRPIDACKSVFSKIFVTYCSTRLIDKIEQAALVEAELLPGGEEVAQSTSGQDDDLTNFQSQQGSEDGGQTSYDPMNQTHGHQRDNATLSAPTTSATALTATNEQADGSDTFSSAGNIDTLQENYEISADGIRMRENSVHDLLSSVQAFLEHRRLARNAANKAKQIIAQRIVAIHEALEAAGQPNPPTVPPTGTPTSHDGDDTPI